MGAHPQRRKPAYAVTSVDNALRLLQILRDVGEIRVSEAAAELDISPSTVHRLMSMLVYRGFAARGDSRSYQPGPAIGVEPVRFENTRRLQFIARRHLGALRDEIGESTYLMILTRTSVRFILTLESAAASHAGDRHGFVIPAQASASGRAILAGLTPAALDEVIRLMVGDHRLETGTQAALERLHRELANVRALGYSASVDEVEIGIGSVAVPLRCEPFPPPAAISIAAPSARAAALTSPFVIERLFRARDTIEREIAASVDRGVA